MEHVDHVGEQRERLTLEEREKRRNDRSKAFGQKIGKNINYIICVMVLILPIIKIWVEVGFPVFSTRMIGDALLIVLMFFVGEYGAVEIGKASGKMDDDHIKYRAELDELRKKIYATIGTDRMDEYCDAAIDKEYKQAFKNSLRRAGITPDEFEKHVRHKTRNDLVSRYGLAKGTELFAIKKLKPIELNPDLIMMDGIGRTERGDIKESGEQYARKKLIGKVHIAMTIFSAMCIYIPQLTNSDGFSFAALVTAFVTIMAVVWRMSAGYARGVRAYNVVEIKHLQSRIGHMYAYMEYIRNTPVAVPAPTESVEVGKLQAS